MTKDGAMVQQEATSQGDSSQEQFNTGADATQARAPSELRSASLEETQRLGALLGQLLGAGDVVLLTGTLGAGKTAFTQGIGVGLGVRETINSPTFTLVKEYAGRLPLYHFDLYRIEEPQELYALGFEEYFAGDGVAVVEWAERGEDAQGAIWPATWLRVELRASQAHAEERTLTLSAVGQRGREMLADFLAAVARAGHSGASCEDRGGVGASPATSDTRGAARGGV